MLISVVIPVYNVELYIEKCIESVINQTYNDLEIIIINDGCTDNSVNKIQKYIDDDERIVLINQKNSGLSEARNRGIEIAKGDYIIFIDSDDFVDKTMIEKIVEKAVSTDSDIVTFNMKRWNYHDDKEIPFPSIFYDENIIMDNVEASKMLLLGKISGYAWDKIYKRQLFDGVRYKKGMLYEDFPTTFDLIKKSNKVSHVNDPLYFYVKRNSSINQIVKRKGILDFYFRINYIESNLNLVLYKEEIKVFYINTYIVLYKLIHKYYLNNKKDNELNRIRKEAKKFKIIEIITNENIYKNEKFNYLLVQTHIWKVLFKCKIILSKLSSKNRRIKINE